MFCSQCGSKSFGDVNFCSNCGYSLKSAAEVVPRTSSAPKTVSFDEFKLRKERERTSRFEPKGKKAKLAEKCKAKESEVSISVGYMKLDKSGNFKKCRGKTLPVKVLPSADRKSILEKAVTKHANHDKTIHQGLEYVLLYPDGNEVINLPGTDKEFILKEYREDIGKTYNRLTLFIATKSDFLFSELPNLDDDTDYDNDESLSDSELLHGIYETRSSRPTKSREGQTTATGTSKAEVKVLDIGSANQTKVNVAADTPQMQEPLKDVVKEQKIECPTCLKLFPVSLIADHADLCCDIWVGEVGSLSPDSPPSFPLEPPQVGAEDPQASVDVPQGSVNADVTLQDVISSLSKTLPEKPVRLNVRRKNMWSDFKEARVKGRVSPGDRLKIVFIGEPAIDDGGPKREFFSEMLEHLERKLFLNGKPIDSTVSLNNGDFRFAGEIMAMSILQCGPAPSFIDLNVFNYISGQPLSPETNEPKYKEAALKIKNAHDDKELQEVLLTNEVFEVLEEIGYSGVPHRETLKNSSNIVQSICIKSQFVTSLPQLMQLQEGLNSNGLLASIREFPKMWEAVFAPNESSFTLSADDFLDQLVATFSFSQAQKQLEIDVFKHFSDFVQFLDAQGDLTISDLVKWMTGTRTVPVLGFTKKFSISFVHGCSTGCRCRPTTSTCDLLLKMPVHINSFEDMVEMMSSALKDCIGFGLV